MQALFAEIVWVLAILDTYIRSPGECKKSDILESILSIGAFLKQAILWAINQFLWLAD